MELEIDFNKLIRKRKAIVFNNLEDAIALLHEAKKCRPELVILWNDGDLELRYNMVQPIRFAVSFHRGSMQYMKEDYYIEHEYELINFSDLIRAEPIFESDIPIGDLFKVV